jgi:hypothetical protein
MSDEKVIPFRKRPPSEPVMDVYRHMTRGWHAEMRRLMFPEHFAHEQKPPKK